MSAVEFDPNLIRLPLDYKGTPALAEIRVYGAQYCAAGCEQWRVRDRP